MPNHISGPTLAVFCLVSFTSLLSIAVDGQCSGTPLTVDASLDISYVTSVGYSNGIGTYASNLDCKWLLNSGNSSLKLLIYIENYDVTCPGDVINIYDGSSTGISKLANNLCGSTNSPVYVTSGQAALLTFTSDGSTQATGFKLAVMAAADMSGTGCSSPEILTPSNINQYLTSPAFPAIYTTNSDCLWTIRSSGPIALEVSFTDIETSTKCAFDGLIIYDGEFICDQIIALSACTPYPNGPTLSYTSNGTSITIKFKSDGSISYHGFILKYYNAVTTTTTPAPTPINATDTTTDTKDDDQFYLIAGIAFLTGFSCALVCVGLFLLIKYVHKRNNRTLSAKSRQISPHLHALRSRNNSTCGSTISDDSFRHEESNSTPVSLNSSLALTIPSHRNSNGFLKPSNGLLSRSSLTQGMHSKSTNQSNGIVHNKNMPNSIAKTVVPNGKAKIQKGK